MDLNSDGVLDVISGSHQKGIWMYRGLGDGKYDVGVPLVMEDGSPVNPGVALAPAFSDWDADGDLDLVLGTSRGVVLLLPNEGRMRFGKPQSLTLNGEEITAVHGGPCVYDFDEDGVLDLLIGDVEGNLSMYFGAQAGSLDFKKQLSVLPYQFDPKPRYPLPKPGIRMKPTVVDWNSDGKMDVLFGDYRPTAETVDGVTEEQRARISELRLQDSRLAFEIMSRSDKLSKQAKEETGIQDLRNATSEQRVEYNKVLATLMAEDEQYLSLVKQKDECSAGLKKAMTRRRTYGAVWIMLRK